MVFKIKESEERNKRIKFLEEELFRLNQEKAKNEESSGSPSSEKLSDVKYLQFTFDFYFLIGNKKEQEEIVKAVVEMNNLKVIAKAGSGKTKVAFEAASEFWKKHKKKALLLTYNTRLKEENRAEVKNKCMTDFLQVHSYHAAACKFFKGQIKVPDDELIIKASQENTKIKLDFGLVIIDEAQDCKSIFADLVRSILKHNSCKPLLMIMGDPFQQIYRYQGSSNDFLLNPEKHFGELIYPKEFKEMHLSICWRITPAIAEFLNTKLSPLNLCKKYSSFWKEKGEMIEKWWGKGIKGNPSKPYNKSDVVEIVEKNFTSAQLVEEVNKLFKEFGNDQVALLSLSLKSDKGPISVLVDRLSPGNKDSWLFLGKEEGFKIGENVFRNKRIASTIHKFKGLERKGIFLAGLDDGMENMINAKPHSTPLDHATISL